MNAQSSLIRRTLVVISIIVVVAMILSLLYVARKLLPLVFGSVLIAVVLNHIAGLWGRLMPDHFSRSVRVGLVVTVLTVIATVAVFAFAQSAGRQLSRLTDRIDNSVQQVLTAARDQPFLKRYVGEEQSLSELLPSTGKSLGLATNFFTSALGGVFDILVLIFLSLYFGFSPKKYRDGMLRMMPPRWRDRADQLLAESSTRLWRWMLGRLLSMSIVGILFGIGLAVVGIPMPVELGIFAGLVTFIPNIGGLAAVIPALLLATQQGSSAFFWVLLIYLAIQTVESYLITPLVQEHQVSLPPALVILAQIVAGLIFGFWGIVFATPMFAVAMLWIQRLYVEDWLEAKSASA